jgi:RimJ/RimL family protein N-acetyltransferase
MPTVFIREPQIEDENVFLQAMHHSRALHYPWVQPPLTEEEFHHYLQRYKQDNQKSFLVCDPSGCIAGVFNMNEIVRGLFQSAYLGFYATADYAGKGYMSEGLNLVLKKAFTEMNLHRLEANIQPDNARSILLVQSKHFRREGYSPQYLKINGEWRDHERWAITYEDWAEPNNDG